MGDKLIDLLNKIADAEVELEELTECGTLEERLAAAQRLERLQHEYLAESLRETGGL